MGTRLELHVIHARPLQQRARNVTSVVRALEKQCDVHLRLCTRYDSDAVAGMDTAGLTDFGALAPQQTPLHERFNRHLRGMHVNQLSCALKHQEVLREISEGDDDTLYLVMEDDSVMTADFADMVACVSSAEFDLVLVALDVENPAGTRLCPMAGVFETGFVLPSCNAYFVRPAYARALLQHAQPVRFAWNVQLSYALHLTAPARVFHSARVFLRDGSKTGRFACTQGDSTPSQNAAYLALQAQVSAGKATPEEVSVAVDRCLSAPDAEGKTVLKDHPEVLRLQAAHLSASGRHGDAHAVLLRAADALLREPLVLVNNQSGVMRQLIRSFAQVQEGE